MSLARSSTMKFNPVAGNKLQTRDDVVQAVHQTFNPLLPMFSEGKARVQIDASTSTWDRAACDLEGFARPLFGIAPMVAGGGSFDHWHIYRGGLANGTNPTHAEYWGDIPDRDQRHVEAAALAYGILLCPQHLWNPLDGTAKGNVAAWLIMSRDGEHGSNNHKFFRILVDLALESIGVSVDNNETEAYLRDMESLYIDKGWYRDGEDPGDTNRIDYYNAFAMHYYGLVYAVYTRRDKGRAALFKWRAFEFASKFIHWFADTGANVPYGRSLAYRQCVAAFWGQLAVAGEEVISWGHMKGLYLRNLRWWSEQPISKRDGVLTLGYAYPNPFMAERYLASGSPYWCMKAFCPLSLPESHPFWSAEEMPMLERPPVIGFSIPGMVFQHQPNHTVMLVSGPGTKHAMRWIPEKYHKFAYSSRYGFSIESDPRAFQIAVFDSMIGLSDDDVHYRVREHYESATICGEMLHSVWHPWPDVKVDTWLIPNGPWHLRVHRIISPRKLSTIEGGFAAPRADSNLDLRWTINESAYVLCRSGDFSGILDLSAPQRSARILAPHGNTSVMYPRTLVPQLLGEVEATTPRTFVCAVLADPDGRKILNEWQRPPQAPLVEELERAFHDTGIAVEVSKPYLRHNIMASV